MVLGIGERFGNGKKESNKAACVTKQAIKPGVMASPSAILVAPTQWDRGQEMTSSCFIRTALRALLVAFMLGMFPVSASATLIDDGNHVTDAATGLEWLDLTTTVGQSRAQVLAGSYVAEGFRYATEDQVLQLWDDAGAVGPFVNYGDYVNSLDIVPAQALIGLLGCTSAFDLPLGAHPCVGPVPGLGDVQNFSIGLFGTGALDAAIIDTYYGEFDPRDAGATFRINFGTELGESLLDRVDVGSYLVRPLPEPSSLPMLLAGLGLIGGAFYFRRKKLDLSPPEQPNYCRVVPQWYPRSSLRKLPKRVMLVYH